MATLQGNPKLTLSITLNLSEEEARALEAIAVYGPETVLKVCYEHLARESLERYENGIRTLFASVNSILPSILHRADKAREVYKDGGK